MEMDIKKLGISLIEKVSSDGQLHIKSWSTCLEVEIFSRTSPQKWKVQDIPLGQLQHIWRANLEELPGNRKSSKYEVVNGCASSFKLLSPKRSLQEKKGSIATNIS